MSDVLVVGGGAAGMMAAVMCARNGHRVTIFEQNEKLGKKIYITGKGRCNLTNACDEEELRKNVVTNSRFLFSAFSAFGNLDTISFFESIGLEMKEERGKRIFPVSDHSSDVIRVLEQELKKRKVTIHLHTKVAGIDTSNGVFRALKLENGQMIKGDACIIATGGLSYPTTGATGDGYRFAKSLGHSVTKLYPALVSIRMQGDECGRLEGLALKNIAVKTLIDAVKAEQVESVSKEQNTDSSEAISESGKKDGSSKKEKKPKWKKPGTVLYEDFGEMVFTSRGVSGPVVLSTSSYLADILHQYDISFHIDLKPALTEEQLDARVLREFEEAKNKIFKNVMDKLLPQKLIPVFIERSGISAEKQVNAISKEERRNLVHLLKDFSFRVASLGDFSEAVITKGGVSVKEINPSTMESKLVSGVYFAGEVLDVDALTGGFNLQIAWSSGWVAANNI